MIQRIESMHAEQQRVTTNPRQSKSERILLQQNAVLSAYLPIEQGLCEPPARRTGRSKAPVTGAVWEVKPPRRTLTGADGLK